MKEDYIRKHVALRYFFYPVARVLSRWGLGNRVSPTAITVVWIFTIFVGSAVHLAVDLRFYIFFIFFLAFFLDCLDGQIARDQNSSSDVGKFLDDFGGDLFTFLFWVCYGAYMLPQSGNESHVLYLGIYVGVISILRPVMSYRVSYEATDSVVGAGRRGGNLLQPFSYPLRIFASLWEFGSLMWPSMIIIVLLGLEGPYLIGACALATGKFVYAFMSHVKNHGKA